MATTNRSKKNITAATKKEIKTIGSMEMDLEAAVHITTTTTTTRSEDIVKRRRRRRREPLILVPLLLQL